jgi:serralysin
MPGPGSIAFIRFGADTATPGGKTLSFVLLDPSLRGQTITITDNGWTAAGAFRTGEGTTTVAIPADAALGTVFSVTGLTGTLNPSATGDQFLAYIAGTTPLFLAAVQFASGTAAWAGDATNSNTSAVPTGLTSGTTALAFAQDNGVFTGSLSGTPAQIAAAIQNAANWALDDTVTFNAPGNFTVTPVAGATAGADTLTGTSGTDLLNGLDGDDVLDGGAGADDMYGGAGNDVYVVDNVGDSVTEAANEGIDRVETSLASYSLGLNIENLEYTGAGSFTGNGNGLANIIVGGAFGDALNGGDGDDTLGGEAGDDTLVGGNGNDRLIGGAGTDRLSGGAGNDTLVVDSDAEIGLALGGDGIDTLQLAYSSNGVASLGADIENVSNSFGGTANLFLNALANTYGGGAGSDNVSAGDGNDILYGRGGSDALNGQEGNDRIFGDAGDDVLAGENGIDLLYGGADTDTLYGGGGNDTLYGEAGNDILEGGAGLDILNGGLGADTFRFSAGDTGATVATADRIQGYSSAQGDQIDVSALGVTSFIGTAAFSNVAGEVRTQVINGNTFVQGDVDGDGVADFMIRLDGIISLTADDLVFGGLN